MAGKTKSWSDVESPQWRSGFGRTNIFPGSRKLGLHSKTMPNKLRFCGQWQNHVPIANFRLENGKITIPSKSSYFFMVLWYGGSCKEMCGTILWIGKQNDSTTLQCMNSMHWWPSFQRIRIEIRVRIVTNMLPNCSEMFILGTNWNESRQNIKQKDWVLDTGHFLVQLLKIGILEMRIIDIEPGIMWEKKCFWNSQKADILISVQRLHCPKVFWRTKDMKNCWYTSL